MHVRAVVSRHRSSLLAERCRRRASAVRSHTNRSTSQEHRKNGSPKTTDCVVTNADGWPVSVVESREHSMKKPYRVFTLSVSAAALCLMPAFGAESLPLTKSESAEKSASSAATQQRQRILPVSRTVREMLDDGRQIFRYDTFGNETFWGGTLRLHEAIAGTPHGGVGPGVSPSVALSVGLKVDVEPLP